MSKHLALYARVSTDSQTIDPQRDTLEAYTKRRGDSAVLYVDEGVSGAKDSRPGLDAMMAAVRRREVSAVVVTKLDRLGAACATSRTSPRRTRAPRGRPRGPRPGHRHRDPLGPAAVRRARLGRRVRAGVNPGEDAGGHAGGEGARHGVRPRLA